MFSLLLNMNFWFVIENWNRVHKGMLLVATATWSLAPHIHVSSSKTLNPKLLSMGRFSTLRERENKEKLVEQRGVAAANLPQRTHLAVSGELVGEMGDGLAHFIHILPLMVVPFQ